MKDVGNKDGRIVLDERDDWSERQPTAELENECICEHGLAEYQRWYLGIDDFAVGLAAALHGMLDEADLTRPGRRGR